MCTFRRKEASKDSKEEKALEHPGKVLLLILLVYDYKVIDLFFITKVH